MLSFDIDVFPPFEVSILFIDWLVEEGLSREVVGVFIPSDFHDVFSSVSPDFSDFSF